MPNKLKEIRRGQSLSVLALGVKAGVSTNTLVAVEKYGYSPKAETKAKISSALGVRISEIWPEDTLPDGLIESTPPKQNKLQGAAA